MNQEHPNIQVLKQFNPLDITSALKVLAEDVVFHFYNSELADMQGDYAGHQGFLEFFEKMAERSQGTFQMNPVSATPFGDELVVVHTINTMNIKNMPIEVDAVVVWRIVNGKIKEVWDIPAVYTARQMERSQQ